MNRVAWVVAGGSAVLGSLTSVVLAAGSAAPAPVVPPGGARGQEFFEAKVRPILVQRCAGCHAGKLAKGGLDLQSREALLKGGTLGPAVVPGDPERSPLIQAIRYTGKLKMPLGTKLADAEIQVLTEWVRQGAPWGIAGAGTGSRNAGLPHWSFRPVRQPALPPVKNRAWVKTPIDAFVLAELERRGLQPSAPADPRTLIRRATFDLIGLPPTPAEVEAFVREVEAERHASPNPSPGGRGGLSGTSATPRPSSSAAFSGGQQKQPASGPATGTNSPLSPPGGGVPTAYERLIDRLLASPQYGERWGRRWLDVVRYSDSNGLDWNEVFPNAWRYRDYVIRAFNQDKPYNQFIREQLAGDQLPAATDAERYEHLVATGMLVMGPKLLAQQDRAQLAMDVADEQIDVTSKAFLGLTVSCARCHDHKFDPIPTKDYYALAGIFKSTVTLNGTLPRNGRVMYWMERPLAPTEQLTAWKSHQEAVKKLQDAVKKSKDTAEKARLGEEIKKLEAAAPPSVPMAMAVQDGKVENVRVHVRGNHRNLGEEAPRGFLTSVTGHRDPVPADHSGRLELANWIASAENPLTARVMVNRVWQGHFGRGLVATPDNFGLLGEKPSHPELLDWLAARFAGVESPESRVPSRTSPDSGLGTRDAGLSPWSLKSLHRLIMLSATYQQSSHPIPNPQSIDPENRLLWRMNRQRLEAEAIRDAVLQASGQLDRTPGGSLLTRTSGLAGKEFPVDYQSNRRSVYLPVVRGVIYDMFQVFDFADPHVVNGRRDTTTVAPQALFMMNSPFVMEQAAKFAELLQAQPDDTRRIETAYARALGRQPSIEERQAALSFVETYAQELERTEPDAQKRRAAAWQSFCQALFASTEFRYVP